MMSKGILPRRLNHDVSNISAVIAYVLFTLVLLICGYIFWSHNQTYAPYEEEIDEV
jgi:hypothetical protein